MSNISKLLLTLGFTGMHLFASAAGEVLQPTTPKDETLLYVLMVTILVVVLGVVFALAGMVLSNVSDLRREFLASQGLLPEEPIEVEDILTRALRRFWVRANDIKPIEQEAEIALDHSYDGIRELDNNLPPWWKALFYGSIVWSVVYLFYYHVTGSGMLSEQEFKAEMKQAEIAHELYLLTAADLVNENSVEPLTDPRALATGKSLYMENCVACHGAFGEGGVGPNFTDNYWIHGGGIKNIFKTVKYGVPAKGMISWSNQLKASEMQQVSSYILTLQGTNPPNPKEPQGTVWEDITEDTEASIDTTAEPADSIVIE